MTLFRHARTPAAHGGSVALSPRVAGALALLMGALAGCSSVGSEWRDAEQRNSIEGYQEFLRRYPSSTHERAARARLLTLRWAQLRSSADLAQVTAFQGEVEREAKISGRASPLAEPIATRLAELSWERVRGTSNPADIEAFLKAFPKAAALREATDRLDDLTWEATQRQATPAAWRAYLKRFGAGRHAAQARQLGEGPSWAEARAAGEEAVMREHLALFPGGATAGDARQAVAERVWQRAEHDRTDARPYREYLELLPAGAQALLAQDALDWAQAESEGTLKAVEQYLRRYPQGRFAARARDALPVLREALPLKVGATVNEATGALRSHVVNSLKQARALRPVQIQGTAHLAGPAIQVSWQGGGMFSISSTSPGKDNKAEAPYVLNCAFTGEVGPSGLTSLAIANSPRATLRLDGVSYVHTAEGWSRQIDRYFKDRKDP
jgi:hypothetical protein